MDLIDYNSSWITPIKKYDKFYASLEPKIQSQQNLNSTLHAQNRKISYSPSGVYASGYNENQPNLFDHMANLNKVVD